MKIYNWILAVVYALLFTYALVMLLKPGAVLELGVIAGSVLTLVLSYAPGVAAAYNTLVAEAKQLVNVILTIFVALVIFGLSCASLIDLGIACTVAGALDLLMLILISLISNSGVYKANNYIAAKFLAK